jgi:lipid A 3-O-deacylase
LWNNFAGSNIDYSIDDYHLPNVTTAMGYFFGQNMYTPDHADAPSKRSKEDRVFAGWLYGGAFAQRAAANQMEHFELNMGIIGPSAFGGELQTFVHDLVRQDEPNGWEKQLEDEFAVDFTWLKKQYIGLPPFNRTSNFDSLLEYGFTVGSVHRNAVLSVLFRAGFNLPNDFGPGRLEAPACAAYTVSDELTHFYLFARLSGKLVEHDRFLTGLHEKPAVGVIQFGGSFRYKSLELTYSQTFLTREYDEQPDADSFASLTFMYRF